MPRASRTVLALFLVCSGPAVASRAATRPARYIVFTVDEDGIARPEVHKTVELATERASLAEAELRENERTPPAAVDLASIRLLDAAGQVVFRDVVAIRGGPRPEHGLHGEESADPFPPSLGPRAFVARVPWIPGSRLRLTTHPSPATNAGDSPAAAVRQDFDLDALAKDEALPLARFSPEARFLAAPAPNSGNRVDLLVMGDGYTAAQASKFAADSASVLASFFGISPYAPYQNYFNLATLFTASNQAGADHPPYLPTCAVVYPPTCCSDPLMQTDPLRGTFVDTAFDGAYCSTNTHRQVTVTPAKVLAAAAAAPDWDEILVIVNDTTYGGSGGAFSVVSTNGAAVDVARHEFGHTFTRLTDEYTTPYPGFPACSDLGGAAPCEANATDQTSRALLKWAPFVSAATPIPTPDTPAFDGLVGLFAGARYQTAGMYRPARRCLMNLLGNPFCPVCAQEFVLRLYRGGWGVPAAGIDLVEPGSESPPPGTVSMTFPGSRTFSIGLLAPAGGPAPSVTWAVNGGAVAGAAAPSFDFTPPSPGRYVVTVTVRDVTPLVQPTMAGSSLTRTRTWTLNVSPLGDVSITKRDDGRARDGQPLTYTLTVGNAGPDAASAVTVSDPLPAQITAATWTCAATTGSSCPASGSGNVNAVVSLAVSGVASFTVTGTVAAGTARQVVNVATATVAGPFADVDPSNNTAALATPVARAMRFYPLTPCRAVDTRITDLPALGAGVVRTFAIGGRCLVPGSAWAVSVNLTLTQATDAGNLRAYPAGIPLPLVSNLNYVAGQTRANSMVLALDAAGQAAVLASQASGSAHFILDVNGYFE
jgi:uncharacterized repeat protein (TIGR01451 family)